MKTPKLLTALAGACAFLALAAPVKAWHVSGQVLCDENGNLQFDVGDHPVQGVMVVVQNTSRTYSQAYSTGADGKFLMALPDVPDAYECFIHPPTIPAGSTVIRPTGGVHSFSLTNAQQSYVADFLLSCDDEEEPPPPPPPPPPPAGEECGKLTGGGWIPAPNGAKASFSVSGGIQHGGFWGQLNYIDHGTKMHVKSVAVTGFDNDPSDPNGRLIQYEVTINGVAGSALVRAVDNGEPGRDDVFEIQLSNGYSAGDTLAGADPGGGNIQLHKCPPGWEKSKGAAKR